MRCEKYHLEIELLPSLDDDAARFKPVISHLQECPGCLSRFHGSRKLDNILKAKLNALDYPLSLSAMILSHIQYSSMPELRRAILKEVKSTAIHPPACWIYRRVERKFPQTSIRSISRHLIILQDKGYIREFDFGEGFKRFDRNLSPHCHFICQECHKVCDIRRPAGELVDLARIHNMGYLVVDPNLEIRGICKKCSRPGKRSAGNPGLTH